MVHFVDSIRKSQIIYQLLKSGNQKIQNKKSKIQISLGALLMYLQNKHQNVEEGDGLSLWKSLLKVDQKKIQQNYQITKTNLQSQELQSLAINSKDLLIQNYDQLYMDQQVLIGGLEEGQYQLDCLNFRKIISQFNFGCQNQNRNIPVQDSNSQEVLQNKLNDQIPKETGNENQQIPFEFESIFKPKQIRGRWKKNTNVPKFITRIFMKYFYNYVKEKDNAHAYQHHKKIKRKLSERPTNNFCIQDVLLLLRNEKEQSGEITQFNQKIMARIISQNLFEQIIGKSNELHDCHENIFFEVQIKSFNLKSQDFLIQLQSNKNNCLVANSTVS